jgi:hypothetical protein
MDETITRFGGRVLDLTDLVIREHGGKSMSVAGTEVYRLQIQQRANVERLPDQQHEPALLRGRWKGEIERTIAKAGPDGLARAAYLAICFDMAEDLRRSYPEQWRRAVAALQSEARVMQALFYESPLPAGEALRAKALAAGLAKPNRQTKLWTTESLLPRGRETH